VRRYGADALRYTVVAGAGLGTDLHMDHENLDETFAPGRNFANKVWNAGRFAMLNVEGAAIRPVAELGDALELADRWILSRFHAAAQQVTRQLESFRFHEAAASVYHFFWGELADWYLELVKPRMGAGAEEGSRAAAQATLVAVLDGVLRLLHPVMPFISEALWQRLPVPAGTERERSLVVAAWPEGDPAWRDAAAEERMTELMELISVLRTIRSEYDVPVAARVTARLAEVTPALEAALAVELRAVQRMARTDLDAGAATGGGAGASAVLRGGTVVFVPLEGLVDLERERGRLRKEIERLDGQVRATEGKLTNEKFVSRAPADVVQKERDKVAAFRDQRDRLSEKLAALA
jgi:valyl-tRNA synthetase